MDGATKRGEHRAGQLVAAVVRANAPAKLRNLGKNGTPLNVLVGNVPGGTLVRGQRGAWALWEFGARAHLIGMGRGKKMKRGFLKFPSGDVRLGPVAHPGFRGRHDFEKGVQIASPEVPHIIDAEVKLALLKEFGF